MASSPLQQQHHSSRLFAPLAIGHMTLSSRIIMGPLCSGLADAHNMLSAAAVPYYGDRARTRGTLIIAEASFISASASGTAEARAGIWTAEQIRAWQAVVVRVHDAGSYIFLQLWALGRGADPAIKQRDGTGDVVSSSAVPESAGAHVPRALTEQEIEGYVEAYATAARNAVEGAGFDGVELHGGNGSLIDQFTQAVVNRREDAWGGSDARRAGFALEVTRAVIGAVGKERVGFRVSPWSTYGGMGIGEATIPQFTTLLQGLKELEIAYLHLVESRIAGRVDVAAGGSLQPFTDLWGGASPIVLAGGYSPELARGAVDEEYRGQDVGIAFGRAFVTNPDLVQRLRDGVELRGE